MPQFLLGLEASGARLPLIFVSEIGATVVSGVIVISGQTSPNFRISLAIYLILNAISQVSFVVSFAAGMDGTSTLAFIGAGSCHAPMRARFGVRAELGNSNIFDRQVVGVQIITKYPCLA